MPSSLAAKRLARRAPLPFASAKLRFAFAEGLRQALKGLRCDEGRRSLPEEHKQARRACTNLGRASPFPRYLSRPLRGLPLRRVRARRALTRRVRRGLRPLLLAREACWISFADPIRIHSNSNSWHELRSCRQEFETKLRLVSIWLAPWSFAPGQPN